MSGLGMAQEINLLLTIYDLPEDKNYYQNLLRHTNISELSVRRLLVSFENKGIIMYTGKTSDNRIKPFTLTEQGKRAARDCKKISHLLRKTGKDYTELKDMNDVRFDKSYIRYTGKES